MVQRIKNLAPYDPFNPPGATRLHIFAPAVQKDPYRRDLAPAEEPVPAQQATFKPPGGPWVPEGYEVAENQVARVAVPVGQQPDKIELALHPPGARAENTFTLG